MKILQICSKSPYPPREGGPIAMNNITQGLLTAGHMIKVLAINTPKYFIKPEDIPSSYLKRTGYEAVYVDTGIKVYKAFMNLFSTRSYNVDRFISTEFKNKIKQILIDSNYDVVQIESIYIAPYIETIRKYSNAKIVLRAHNIEHIIWQRLTDNCRNPLKKRYLRHLTSTLKNLELDVINKVDGIAAITPFDADFIIQQGINKPVISIPVGIDQNNIPSYESEREFPGLFHIGSMDWRPNQEGIKWFLENVWQDLLVEFNYLQFHLAGRNMPDWLINKKIPGVIIEGEVKDAIKFMQSKSIMIVPLLAGSGIRVKIIEGMACGNTIISTSIGAEGINYTNGENILLADSHREFILQIKKCISDPLICSNIGLKAKQLVTSEYRNDIITGKLIEFYEKLASGNLYSAS